MPPVVKMILSESADVLMRTVKVTIMVGALMMMLIFVGWLFSSDLPHQAILLMNGR